MRVGDLATAVKLTTKTIRFYEQAGLLPAPPRTPGGYRDYPPQTPARLAFIREARGAGLTLAEIRSVLTLRDGGQAPCEHVTGLIDQRLPTSNAAWASWPRRARPCAVWPGERPAPTRPPAPRTTSARSSPRPGISPAQRPPARSGRRGEPAAVEVEVPRRTAVDVRDSTTAHVASARAVRWLLWPSSSSSPSSRCSPVWPRTAGSGRIWSAPTTTRVWR
ncbi:heavy metal-responsive transcriptional regulator [Streptomyces sp. NPDC001568]|uniref:heavy metal-responsive transcriptional regulator n=1 Tax=Streptomyces sp. NPDC001568 TaxID=3364588 RepID=UPI0036A45844